MFLSLSGCSYVIDLVVFNNSDLDIEVCNLNYIERDCEIILSKEVAKISLIGSKPAKFWSYSINKKIYEFSFGPYPEHASKVYCNGFIQKKCDIAIQYESTGLLYWAGKTSKLPVKIFPDQPKGFPVEPNT